MKERRFQDGFGGSIAHKFPSQVETLPQVRSTLPEAPGAGMPNDGDGDEHGFACQEGKCSKVCKSSHGYARHLKTHGFGVLGRRLR